MPSLADSARELGLDPLERVDTAQFAPPRLSNSTRRYVSPAQQDFNTFSPAGRVTREALVEQDKQDDEMWSREMARLKEAADWNRKVTVQEQAISALGRLKNLTGAEDDYQEQLFSVLRDHPLARVDEAVGTLMKSQSALYDTKQATKKEANDVLTRSTQKQNEEKSEIAEEFGVEGLAEYDRVINETGSPFKAIAAAARSGETKKNAVSLAEAGADTTIYDPAVGAVADVPSEVAKDSVETAKRVKAAKDNEISRQQLSAARAGASAVADRIKAIEKSLLDPALSEIDKSAKLVQLQNEQQELAPYQRVIDQAAGIDKGQEEKPDVREKEQQALRWAAGNPNDPRAKRIIQLLGTSNEQL